MSNRKIIIAIMIVIYLLLINMHVEEEVKNKEDVVDSLKNLISHVSCINVCQKNFDKNMTYCYDYSFLKKASSSAFRDRTDQTDSIDDQCYEKCDLE